MKVIIVRALVSAVVALVILWGFWHLLYWLEPRYIWLDLTLCGVLAVDYALMISGFAPRGFRDWPKLWRRS